MVTEQTVATVAAVMVTASFPFYLYGAWIMIDREADNVTWAVLRRHLAYIFPGLALNTVPVVAWMIPRLVEQIEGLAVLHAFFGLQAYALLAFGLTGIVRILQVKWRADLYRDPDPDVDLDALHEHMPAWRRRLRIGVFGYVLFWVFAYVVGIYRFYLLYFTSGT